MPSKKESIMKIFDVLGGGNQAKAETYAQFTEEFSDKVVAEAVDAVIANHEYGPVRPAHLISRCRALAEQACSTVVATADMGTRLTDDEKLICYRNAQLSRRGVYWHGREDGYVVGTPISIGRVPSLEAPSLSEVTAAWEEHCEKPELPEVECPF